MNEWTSYNLPVFVSDMFRGGGEGRGVCVCEGVAMTRWAGGRLGVNTRLNWFGNVAPQGSELCMETGRRDDKNQLIKQ